VGERPQWAVNGVSKSVDGECRKMESGFCVYYDFLECPCVRGIFGIFFFIRLPIGTKTKGNHMSKKLKNAPSKKPHKPSGNGRGNNLPKSNSAIKTKGAKNG
jgi:hypothetical protein